MANNSKSERWLLKHGYNLSGKHVAIPNRPKKKGGHGKQKLKERILKSKVITAQRRSVVSSPGEQIIEQFLMKNDVRFIREYSTSYCYNHKTNHFLYFDFWLPDHNAAIEYDGLHHFKPIYGVERLKEQKYRDMVKSRYCRRRGIALLRIACFDGKMAEELICKFFDLVLQGS